MLEDKRHFQRFVHDAKTQLDVDGHVYTGQLLDLSLKGCLIALPEDWPKATPEQGIRVSILLGENISISSKAALRHDHDDHTAGFAFEGIDLDSMTNLRRMVELNIGDCSILERELNVLAGAFKP